MTQARRILCVARDSAVVAQVRRALADAVPDVELEATPSTDGAISDEYSAAVITDDVDVDPRDVVADIHTTNPGLPILVAARNGGGELASDVLVAGAASYVPLDDDARLRDRLGRLVGSENQLTRFFDHLVEHVGAGVGAYGRDGTISYANSAYAELLGVTPSELRGRPIWDVNPEFDAEQFDEYFDSFAPGETRHADAVHVRADGTRLPVHTVSTRVDISGTALHVGTITDISTRVETQRKIEALHDIATDLGDLDSVDAVYDVVVDAAERILNLHACYVMVDRGDHFFITAHSENAYFDMQEIPKDYGVIAETFDTQEPMRIEDAQSHPIAEPTSDKFRSGVSAPVGHYGVFQAVSTEVGAFTEEDLELASLLSTHAAAAIERVQHENAMRTERDRLAALFQNIPNPAVEYEIQDVDKTIATAVNPAFESVFGFEADYIVGRDIDEAIVPPADIEQARGFNSDLSLGQTITTEVKRLTTTGPHDFLLHVVPHTVDEVNSAGFAIYTDITEQKQRERQLERQNDRLEEFTSVVSHDLRNPLNVATGRLELANQEASGDVAEHVSHAQAALERMDDLIADLLTLAREGRSLGETDSVDLGQIAREAWATVDTADATLEVNEAPTVEADAERVRQLFENLFRNAIMHGGKDVTVTVEHAPNGFAVADDGRGIPEEERRDIFTSGYSTNETGTGFGLSIVERIAGAHGWLVEVGESEGGGARFRFHFPVTDRPEQHPNAM